MSSVNLESYPLEFRHIKNSTTTENNLINSNCAKDDNLDTLPEIDVQSIDIDKLREVCTDWGAFRLVNHGIPSEFFRKLEAHAKVVFDLSFETKREILKDPLTYFWGTLFLTQTGGAVPKGHINFDWMEGVNFPLPQISQFQSEEPIVHSLRDVIEEYGRHMSRIARTLFEGIAKNLKLDPKLSKLHLAESSEFVRIYRYPPCAEPGESMGLTAHTDSALLTILFQDLVGGFEVLKGDEWVKIKHVPDTLVVNLGDMMQLISDDEYKAVVHKVRANPSMERNSIGYFVSPEGDFVIESSKYKPLSYNDYRAQVKEDIDTYGDKVGLSRFKIE